MSSTVKALVEAALPDFDGSESVLAQRLGVSRQRLNDWKHSRLPIPDNRLAHLANLAGIPEQQAIAMYAVEKYELKKRSRAASIAALVIAAGAVLQGVIPRTADAAAHNVQSVIRRLLALSRSLANASERARSDDRTLAQGYTAP